MLTLKWIKCGKDRRWCPLMRLSLETVNAQGVYIIWHAGNPGRVVRVGQGDVAKRLADHRTDREIIAYGKQGTLYVTWASVPANQRAGVEAHLAEKWNPLVGDRFPDVRPIAVNSPWS